MGNTYTLNLSYGNGLIADGTGVLHNNVAADFAATGVRMVWPVARPRMHRRRASGHCQMTADHRDERWQAVSRHWRAGAAASFTRLKIISSADHGMNFARPGAAGFSSGCKDEVFARDYRTCLQGLVDRAHDCTRVTNTAAN